MNQIQQVPARQEIPELDPHELELPPIAQQSYFDDVPAEDLQSVPFPRKALFAILIALGLFVLFGGWWWYEQQQPTQTVIQDFQLEDQSDLGDEEFTENGNQMELENGMLTEPVEIFTIPADSRWEDNRWRFELTQVHLAPQVSDLIEENGEVFADNNYLVFEITVTDTRDVGESRIVLAHDYVNIRRESRNETPLGENYLSLFPGQSDTVFVIFRVPQDELTFLGLTGILSNPYLVEIDTSDPAALQRVGLLLKEEGYVEN